jgi:hypothetical protein
VADCLSEDIGGESQSSDKKTGNRKTELWQLSQKQEELLIPGYPGFA